MISLKKNKRRCHGGSLIAIDEGMVADDRMNVDSRFFKNSGIEFPTKGRLLRAFYRTRQTTPVPNAMQAPCFVNNK